MYSMTLYVCCKIKSTYNSGFCNVFRVMAESSTGCRLAGSAIGRKGNKLILWSEIQGGPNFPHPGLFNPSPHPIFVGSNLFMLFDSKIFVMSCNFYSCFSCLPRLWESRFLSPLFPPSVHFLSPFLLSTHPLCPSTLLERLLYIHK